MQNEQYINHEVRVQLIEKLIEKFDQRFAFIDERFDRLENKIDSHFKWTFGSMLGLIGILITFLGTIVLHGMKLI